MPLDLSPQMVGLIVLGGLALLTAVAVVCSGRNEELQAGIDIVLADKPEPEDFLSVWDDVLVMSEEDIARRLQELDATTDWAGPARYRRGVRRNIPAPREPYDVEKEGL